MRFTLALILSAALATAPERNADAQFLTAGPGLATVPQSGSCAYTPPLDANSASLAYSFRLLRTAYSGGNVVAIKRSSDSTTKTFALTAPNCTINQSDAFFDGSTYAVTTWYDQSGNGKNLSPGTKAPTVTLNCLNGQPCVNMASASSQYLAANTGLAITANTSAMVAKLTDQTASHSFSTIGDGTGTNVTWLLWSSSSTQCQDRRSSSAGTQTATASCSNNTWHRLVATSNASLSRIVVDGTQGTDSAASQSIVSGGWVCLGCSAPNATPGSFLQGAIAEDVVFAPDVATTNSNTVSSNQSAFWGIP